MTRTVAEIDAKVNELERRLQLLESDPRIITDGRGFDLLTGWTEDSDSPLDAYLYEDGTAGMTGKLVTPGSSQTQVCTLPDVYRPQGSSKVRGSAVLGDYIGLTLDDAYVEVDSGGVVSVSLDVSVKVDMDIWINMSWNTRYPGVS